MKETEKEKDMIGREVYTPIGKGKIIFVFQNDTACVIFPWGAGQIFSMIELFPTIGSLMEIGK